MVSHSNHNSPTFETSSVSERFSQSNNIADISGVEEAKLWAELNGVTDPQ